MEIKSLANISLDTLFNSFQKAFATYEMQLEKPGLIAMLQRRGFVPELSFAAFDGDEIVSFTFNGIDNYNGIHTAYDTGTGTLKAYQGKGLATEVFNYSIPFLKNAGIQEYLLEVLQHNTAAVSVYKKIGFLETREFYYFRQKTAAITHSIKSTGLNYTIKPININEYRVVENFWDFKPSWQNSFASINRFSDHFISLGVFEGNTIIGYCVFEPATGDITQIAVDREYRRKGIGTLLFQKILESLQSDAIKIINTDIRCTSITAFLASWHLEPAGKQYEMVKKL